MNMNKKNILTGFFVALLGIASILWYINSKDSTATQNNAYGTNQAIAVEVAQLSIKTIKERLPYLGTIAGTKDGNLSFRVGGTLKAIYVEEGEKVQQGQLLATVSVPELDAQYERTESEFKKAQSSKTFWEREVTTDSTLYKEGAISQTAFNKTAFNYEQALSGFNAAKAALEEVQIRRNQTQLRAPEKGVIGSIMIREGSNVGPNQPVIFFHQGNSIVYADVLEQDIQKGIAVGTPVTAKLDGNNILSGKVQRIDSQAKPPFRSVRVFVEFPDTVFSGRPSGSGISLNFEINKKEGAMLVPASAIDLREEDPRIFKVTDEQKAQAIPVELGIQQGEYRQVQGALDSSDKIISSGVNNVNSGDPVEIIR